MKVVCGCKPGVIARTWSLESLKEVLQELRRDNIFGRHVASVYTVEFQKRGLPHAHILHFLNSEDRFDTPVIHGPCEGDKNARCMKDYGPGVTDGMVSPCCLIHALSSISPLATESDSSVTPASPVTPRKRRLGETPTLTAAPAASTETLETVGGEDVVHVEGNDADSSPPTTA